MAIDARISVTESAVVARTDDGAPVVGGEGAVVVLPQAARALMATARGASRDGTTSLHHDRRVGSTPPAGHWATASLHRSTLPTARPRHRPAAGHCGRSNGVLWSRTRVGDSRQPCSRTPARRRAFYRAAGRAADRCRLRAAELVSNTERSRAVAFGPLSVPWSACRSRIDGLVLRVHGGLDAPPRQRPELRLLP